MSVFYRHLDAGCPNQYSPSPLSPARATSKSTDLQRIDASFTNIGDDGLAALASCTALGTLRIAGCEQVSDAGISNMFGADAAASMGSWMASGTTASHLFHTSIPTPTPKTVQMDYLRVLDLSGCVRLTDFSLVAIGLHCRQLGGISLMNIGTFTDVGVTALAQGCSRLRRIVINQCKEVTDKGMRTLIDYCPKLAAVRVLRVV